MFFIPGWLISIVTFPGIIVHEAGHMFFFRLRGVAVLDVCFVRFANPPGYVIHEKPGDFTSDFLISVGPVILNTTLCFVLCFPAYLRVSVFEIGDPISYVLMWLGLSIGMHSFPSNQDASSLWDAAKTAARGFNPLALLSFPLVIAVYVANVLRILWFDLIYGAAVGIGLPALLLRGAA
jgi:hypothetical protein